MDGLREFNFHMQTVTSALAPADKIRKVAPPHLLAMVSISSSYIPFYQRCELRECRKRLPE
jgi:hypothetical protein